jgi:hypothetical protein
MREEVRTIYRCDFCPKYGLRKHSIERHQKYCCKNPDNHHACLSCANLEIDRTTNDDGYNEKTFYCAVVDLELHSFKAEKIQHSCLGHTTRMPLKCEHFKP